MLFRSRHFAKAFYRDPIGEGCDFVGPGQRVLMDRVEHGGGALRLNAVDADVRVQLFDCESDAGGEPASPDRDDDRVDVMQLVHDFQSDGALSGDDVFVVKRMNKDCAGFFDGLNRGGVGVVIDAVDEDDFRSMAFRGFNFGERGGAGDEDARLDASLDRKSVV